MSARNAMNYEAIRNTIALYCIALDTKDFDLLEQVFTPDVETVYPFGGKRTGVQDIKDAINKRLSPVKTQHAITTQHITIHGDGKSADVVSYFTGKHFGQGKWAGQEVTAWGQYKDTLQLEIPGLRSQDKNDAIPGADGEWLISWREVSFMGRLGEEGVMEGE